MLVMLLNRYMFKRSPFNQNISNWNVNKVNNIQKMFDGNNAICKNNLPSKLQTGVRNC